MGEVEHLPQLFDRLHPPQPLELRLLGLGRECMTGVFGCKLLQSSLLPAFGCAHLHTRPSPFGEELGERGRFPGLPGHDDLRRDARRGAVVLEKERLEHGSEVLAADVLQVERVAVDQFPVSEWEDLHHGPVTLQRESDHVDRPDRAEIRRLPLREVLDAPKAVAIAGGLLKTFVGGGLLHLALQFTLDRLGVPG